MRKPILLLFIVLLALLPTIADTLPPNESDILDQINNSRRLNGAVPLVANPILNEIARIYVDDLASRPVGNAGDNYLLADGTNIDTLLERNGYRRYSSGYVVDLVPVIVVGVQPPELLSFILEDATSDSRQIFSRRMVLGQSSVLPLFLPLFREVGIAYTFNQTTNRNYYVIVTGAQPNVLPLVITTEAAQNINAETVFTRNVFLRIHNENARSIGDRIGDEDIIGGVRDIHISESDDDLPCPSGVVDPDWRPYRSLIEYDVSPGTGEKTIYVQMCDSRGVSLTMSTQVTYQDPDAPETAAPDVLRAAQATQTAAYQATQIAPYLPTVEAILSATPAN